jgi:hypothetical protein
MNDVTKYFIHAHFEQFDMENPTYVICRLHE